MTASNGAVDAAFAPSAAAGAAAVRSESEVEPRRSVVDGRRAEKAFCASDALYMLPPH
jgi:hypothetical protein